MEIPELTEEHVAFMVNVVLKTPVFTVTIIPPDHPHYKVKHEVYEKAAKNAYYLASLGLLRDITDIAGEDIKKISALADKITGYTHRLFEITDDGAWMFQGYIDELEKAQAYRNTIN